MSQGVCSVCWERVTFLAVETRERSGGQCGQEHADGYAGQTVKLVLRGEYYHLIRSVQMQMRLRKRCPSCAIRGFPEQLCQKRPQAQHEKG